MFHFNQPAVGLFIINPLQHKAVSLQTDWQNFKNRKKEKNTTGGKLYSFNEIPTSFIPLLQFLLGFLTTLRKCLIFFLCLWIDRVVRESECIYKMYITGSWSQGLNRKYVERKGQSPKQIQFKLITQFSLQ